MPVIEELKTRQENIREGWLTIVEGPRNGPPLILLAGMLDLWTDYVPVLPQLIRSFHVILVEHRGHGTSEWASDGRYRVIDYADDLITVLERTNLGPVSISGNSLGGLMALNVAARRPDLVRAIALEDAPLLVTEKSSAWTSHWMFPLFPAVVDMLIQWRSGDEQMDGLARRVSMLPLYRPRLEQPLPDRQQAQERMLELIGSDRLDADEQARIGSGWRRYVQGDRPTLGECLPTAVIRSIAEVFATVDARAPAHAAEMILNEGFDHIEALRSVRCPVLLWEADRILGGIVPPDKIETIKSALQHVTHRHFIVEGAGHHIHCDAPDRFVANTVEFFRGFD